LKKQKILKELSKGVSTLRTYLYPSVLQEAAIPILKKDTERISCGSSGSGMAETKTIILLEAFYG
jgi:hypothetical protein